MKRLYSYLILNVYSDGAVPSRYRNGNTLEVSHRWLVYQTFCLGLSTVYRYLHDISGCEYITYKDRNGVIQLRIWDDISGLYRRIIYNKETEG